MSKQKEKEFPIIRCSNDKEWAATKAVATAHAKIHVKASGASPTTAGLIPVLAKLLVPTALLWIREHLIGLTDLLEACLRILVAWIYIRVVLPGQATEGLLHRIAIGAALEPQHLEVIAVAASAHPGWVFN